MKLESVSPEDKAVVKVNQNSIPDEILKVSCTAAVHLVETQYEFFETALF